eukprot:Skav216503  [mRNA]  locus=scaffold1123:609192:614208:- [translate_table: standard]
MEFGPREGCPPSVSTCRREMQDTCLFLHVVKDGNAKRLVRRLDQGGEDDLDDKFDTASWESWRSGFESAGRSRAGSELSVCSNSSAHAMQEYLSHGPHGYLGLDAIEDLQRRTKAERNMAEHQNLEMQGKKRAMVKPVKPLPASELAGEGRSGRVVRTSSKLSCNSGQGEALEGGVVQSA